MIEAYVEASSVDSTPELTYYRLGQKEFVQGLIKDAYTSVEELEHVCNVRKATEIDVFKFITDLEDEK